VATIKDLAAYTGLSTATVSKYLNGFTLKERNAKAIHEAIVELKYRKNDIARSLKTSKSMAIGVLIPTLENPFYSAITSSIERTLMEHGCSTIICSYNAEIHTEKEKIEFLLNKMVDGIIHFPLNRTLDYNILKQVDGTVPLVLVDRPIEGIECDVVMSDNVGAAYGAVELLAQLGHRRIGIILGPDDQYSPAQRFEGYRRVHEKYDIEMDPNLIVRGDYSMNSGRDLLFRLLDGEKAPTAIFATNYETTVGAMIGINERGIALPDDLSFFGFDDFALSTVFRPRLSVVAQPVELIGKTSAELLMRRVRGDLAGFPLSISLETRILVRETVRKI
jgi:LacI family transcriptional regulator